MKDKSIVLSKVTDKEFDILMDLYIELFYKREPLTTYIGFSREKMKQIAETLYGSDYETASDKTLSYIARDSGDSDRPAGFIFCDDPVSSPEQSPPDNMSPEESEKITLMMGILGKLREPLKEKFALGSGKLLHISAVGVAPGYEGKGIATRLINAALEEAQKRNFLYAFSECTSIGSRKCHEKSGFRLIHSVSLDDIEIYMMLKELN